MNLPRFRSVGMVGVLIALTTALTAPSELRAQTNSICAVVKLELQQKATLERQAFDAHLVINNGDPNNSISNLKVQLFIKDSTGNPVGQNFFVKVNSLSGTNAIDGTGVIQSSSSADMHWLIIPSSGTGGSDPSGQQYAVSALITDQFNGSSQTVTTFDAYITVQPQPLIKLEYALPFEVFAQEPLTPDIITPPEPFPLGVRVTNVGFGAANNFQIDSAQPQIVDNKQGLLVDFKLLGTVLAGQTVPNTLLIPFGTIQPNGAALGEWTMSTSLSGRFIQFTSTFTHAADLGGQLTSLIQSVATYTLLKDVLVDLPGRDQIPDFLVNASSNRNLIQDSLDAGIQPPAEMILESDHPNSLIVTEIPSTLSGTLGGSNASLTLSLSSAAPIGSWIHTAVPFALGGQATPASAVRADGKVLDAHNVWLSKHFRKSDLSYVYWINILDQASAAMSYTVRFNAGGLVVPPAPVTDLAAMTVTDGGRLKLSWTASGDSGNTGNIIGGKYLIEAETVSTASFSPSSAQTVVATNTAPGNHEALVLNGLAGNTTYYLRLWTVQSDGNTSSLSNLTTAYTLPVPPVGLAAATIGSNSIAVTWQSGNNQQPIAYVVSLATGSGAVAISSSPLETSSFTYSFAGLQPNTSYYFYGAAINTQSAVSSAQGPLGILVSSAAVPAPAAVTSVSSYSVIANWLLGGNPSDTQFLVQASTDSSFAGTPASSGWIAASSAVLSGLMPGTTYYARVKARNRVGVETAYTELGAARTSAFAILPPQGAPGNAFSLVGAVFGPFAAGNTRVRFGVGGSTAAITSWTSARVNGIVPVLVPGTYAVLLERQNGAVIETLSGGPFTVLPATPSTGTIVTLSPADGDQITVSQPTIEADYSAALGVDTTTVRLTLDGASVAAAISSGSAVFTPSAALSEGTHTVTASVADLFANAATASASFLVDTIAPATALSVDGLTITTTTLTVVSTSALSLVATDAGSGVADTVYLLDVDPNTCDFSAFNGNAAAGTCANPYYGGAFSLSVGTHTLAFYSDDNAGNSENYTHAVLTVRAPAYIAVSADGAATLTSSISSETVTTVVTSSAAGTAYQLAASSQGLRSAGALYDLEPSSTPFNPAATLSIVFNSSGVALSHAALYTFNGVSWDSGPITAQQLTILSSSTARLTGTLVHASLYGVFATPLVDALPPRTALIVGTPQFSSSTVFVAADTMFTLTAVDDRYVVGDSSGVGVVRSFIAIDTAAFSVYAGTFSLAGEGSHTISYYSVDLFGNTESSQTATVALDLTPSISALQVLGPNTTDAFENIRISSAAQIALTAYDPISNGVASGVANLFYVVDSDPFSPACEAVPMDPTAPNGTCANESYGGPFSVAFGTHTVYFFSEDEVGNQENEHTVSISVDAGPENWTGSAGDGLWNTAANWSGERVPNASDDVTIDMNAAVNASGPAISFRSLVLGDDAGSSAVRLTVSAQVTSSGSLTIDGNSVLTQTGLNSITLGALTIRSGGILTHAPNAASFVNELNLVVTGSMTVESGASIGIAGMGYAGGGSGVTGSGPGGGQGFNGCGGAASHSAYGGNSCNGAMAGPIYDDWTNPAMPGSGGGGSVGAGGNGGGVLMLNVGALTLNGSIDASGTNTAGDSGGGSGGAINITASYLTGSGTLKARGGTGGEQMGGGAGGAIKLVTLISDLSNLTFDLSGGSQGSATPCCGGQSGAGGTVYIRRPGETNFSLSVGGPGAVNKPQAVTPFSFPLLVDNLSVANAVIQSTSGLQSITASSSMTLSGAYNLAVTTLTFPTAGLTSFNMPVGSVLSASSMSFDPSWSWTAATLNLPSLTAAKMSFVGGTVNISTLTITGSAPLTIPAGATLISAQLNVPANIDLFVGGTLAAPNASFSPNNINLDGANATLRSLVLSAAFTLPSNASLSVGTFTGTSLTMAGALKASVMNLSGDLTLNGGSVLSTLSPQTTALSIGVGNLTVAANASINLAGQGYAGGSAVVPASGPGAGHGFNGCGGGASHAVYGGNSCNGATAGPIYDDWTNPVLPGSGGGGGGNSDFGGSGGGALILNVSTLTLNGTIDVSGASVSGNAGGGAGGSINITAANLSGAGLLRARGGGGGDQEGGGAGGAIKVVTTASDLSNLTFDLSGGSQGSAHPCCGGQSGAGGTAYVRRPGETNFSLFVGGSGAVNMPQAVTPFSFPLLIDNLNVANAVIQSTTGVLQPITVASSMTLTGAYNLTVTTLSFPTGGLTYFNMPLGAAITASSMSSDPSWNWTAASLNLPSLTAAKMAFAGGVVNITTLTITGSAPLNIPAGAGLVSTQLSVPANIDLLVGGALTAPNASFAPNYINLDGGNVTVAGLTMTKAFSLASNTSLSVTTFTGTGLTMAGTLRASAINLSGDLAMNAGSVLSTLSPQTQALSLNAGNLTIDANASVNLAGMGYRGGIGEMSGSGPGGGIRFNGCGGGASHAAYGGHSCNGATPGALNDDWTNPILPGSGGGGGTFDAGGNGGGALILNVSTLTLNGVIDVSAGNASGFGAGGAGGAINITAANLAGSGSLKARGGSGGAQEAGGSGGAVRIVSLVSDLSNWAFDLSGGSQGTANPCCGTQSGAGGTAYVRRPGEANFNLFVGGPGTVFAPQAITPVSFPLSVDTFTIVNAAFISPAALQPLTIYSSMTVAGISNVTLSTLTLPSPGLSGLTIPSGSSVRTSLVLSRAVSTTSILGAPELVYTAPTGDGAVLVPSSSSSSVVALAAAQSGGLVPVSQLYDLSPENVAFTPNASITFEFDPTILAALGVSTATLGIYDYSVALSTWIPLGGVVGLSGNNITANVATLSSIVAVLGRKNDTIPPVTTISFSTPFFGPSSAPTAVATISSVTLTAVDPSSGSNASSGVAATYYAIDVATPAAVYSGAFHLPAGLHTVYFHSVDLAGNVEATSSATVAVYAGPFVGRVFPSSGPIGVTATFVGFNLGAYNGAKDRVYFGASSTTVLSWNGTTITASVPTLAAGPYALSVAALQNGATVSVQAGTFTVLTPQLFDVLPDSGPIGAAVILDGAGFGTFAGAARSQVLFGGTTAPVTAWNDAQIHATVPGALAAGDYPVTVLRTALDGGTVQSSSQNFHVDAMTLTSINPSTGPVGVSFALYGAGFGAFNGGNTKILFGGTTAQVTSWVDTKVTGLVPFVATGTYNVSLLRLQGNGMAFSNASSFTVTALIVSTPAPAAAPLGALFTLSGKGFGPAGGANTRLNIGGGTIPYASWNDSTISGRVPTLTAGPQPVWIERLTGGGVESSNTTYLQVEVPTIAAVAPSSGPIGAPIVISGLGFGLQNGTSTLVLIAGTTAPVTLWNDTTVQFTVPGDASTGTTTVQLERVAPDGGTSFSNAVAFTIDNLALAAISPSSGPVGESYTLTGAGFGPRNGNNTRVFIGGIATTITSWVDTQIKGTVPLLSSGTYSVQVQRTAGAGLETSNASSFTVTMPRAFAMTPSSAPIGAPFTITGVSFGAYASAANTQVLFNGATAPISLWNDTTIKGSVPGAVAVGSATVVVQRTDPATGSVQASAPSFVVLQPFISTLTPNFGLAGTIVDVYGFGFGPAAGSATHLYVDASTVPFSVWNDAHIRWTVPSSLANGVHQVSVVRSPAGGTVTSNAVNFTVGTMALAAFGTSRAAPALAQLPDAYFQGDVNVPFDQGGRIQTPANAAVTIPANALPADAEVTLNRDKTSYSAARAAGLTSDKLGAVGEAISFGPEGTQFTTPVTLELPYDPALVPTGAIVDLQIYYFDPSSQKWTALASTVDPVRHVVSAQTNHFSLYQPLGRGIGVAAADASFSLKAAYAFPNPVHMGAVTIRIQPGLADSVSVRVYDLSGRKVHDSSNFSLNASLDDGNGLGAQYTYDHIWDVSGVGSGVYTYVITAKRAGNADIHKTGKIGVSK